MGTKQRIQHRVYTYLTQSILYRDSAQLGLQYSPSLCQIVLWHNLSCHSGPYLTFS